jgi:putative endonuclease
VVSLSKRESKERVTISRWAVYIVECSDGTLYTRLTNNLEKRLRNHNNRKGGRYTKGRAPVTHKYTEEYSVKSQAMKREEQLKDRTRAKKR